MELETFLFCTDNGDSLEFYFRLCSNRKELRLKIEKYGGILTSTVRDHTIVLDLPTRKIFNDGTDMFSTHFIDDCIRRCEVLDLNEYRLNKSVYETYNANNIMWKRQAWSDLKKLSDDPNLSDISSMEDDGPPMPPYPQLRRLPYSSKEDKAIIKCIIEWNCYCEIMGKNVWVRMASSKVFEKRSWQSLKEHFIKAILPNIKTYGLTANELHRFQNPKSRYRKENHVSVTEKHPGTSTKSVPTESSVEDVFNNIPEDTINNSTEDRISDIASHQECVSRVSVSVMDQVDIAILDFLFVNGTYNDICGDAIWKWLETTITIHGSNWKKLKDHYFKSIQPNIQKYKLSQEKKQFFKVTEKDIDSSRTTAHSQIAATSAMVQANTTVNETLQTNASATETLRTTNETLLTNVSATETLRTTNSTNGTLRTNVSTNDIAIVRSSSDEGIIESSDVEVNQAAGPSRVTPKAAKKQRKMPHKQLYGIDEDIKILNYVSQRQRLKLIGGNEMWKQMEMDKVLRNRGWQSIKERFRKQIMKNIKQYKISEDVKQHIMKHVTKKGTLR